MRFLLKLVCAPVVALLAITVYFFTFIISLSSAILGIIASVIGLLGALILFTTSVQNGIIILVIAFLISPVGLPLLAAWFLGQLQKLRYAIQERIYG